MKGGEGNADRVTKRAFCRICAACCGIVAGISHGRVFHVSGDRDDPVSRGFTCIKGRAIPEQLAHASRLLHALRRNQNGSHDSIASHQAMDEVAERINRIIEQHGPRSVALYLGSGSAGYSTAIAAAFALWREIKSPMVFTPGSIDQPGKQVASALHGFWQGGPWNPSNADVWMFLGCNPMTTVYAGTYVYNPVQTLRESRRRGMRVVVVDPRRTMLARQSDLHLAIRPGTDPVLLAGLARILLTTDSHDRDFLSRHAIGVEELRAAVEPFSLSRVAAITGLACEDIRQAAKYLSVSRRGGISVGTGPNMAPGSTLTEYLAHCLQSLCGFWLREGDEVANPGVFSPPREWREQAAAPRPALGFGEQLRIAGFGETAGGLPVGLLPEEMMMDGPGRVRALVNLGGNPLSAWPNESKVMAALAGLDLLVSCDVRFSATVALSHYAFGTKFHLEVPEVNNTEGIRSYGAVCDGFPQPFGMYIPALSMPPAGSDLIEEWELMAAIARRQGVPLEINDLSLATAAGLTSDDVLDAVFANAAVNLRDLRAHEGGKLFPSDVRVAAPDASILAERKLNLGDPAGLAGLAAFAGEVRECTRPYLLICRRMWEMKNSWGTDLKATSSRYPAGNPLWMHPEDLRRLQLGEGDAVELRSDHGAVQCYVRPDENGMVGIVSITHGWGGPDDAPSVNLNQLTDNRAGIDPITAMPIFSALPVSVTAINAVEPNSFRKAVATPRLGARINEPR